jgi:hypothetical protein
MIRHLLRVAAVATLMAVLGFALLFPRVSAFPKMTLLLLTRIIIISISLWLSAALIFRSRAVSLRTALGFGAASPFLGAVLLGTIFLSGAGVFTGIEGSLAVVIKRFYVCIPIGIATAYLVHQMGTGRARLA